MNTGLIIAFAFVLVSFSVGDPQFEIRDGNCTKIVDKDLLMTRHVHLTRIPFVSREDKVSLKYVIL